MPYADAHSSEQLVEEIPVAFVCQGVTLAVLMITPTDIEDLAVGLSWSEGWSSDVLRDDQVELQQLTNGIECRLGVDSTALQQLRRLATTSSACGLCGVRSIAQALRAPSTVVDKGLRLCRAQIVDSVVQLRQLQPLHDRTHAAHAAGFLVPDRGFVCVREDIGRHNALDKLIGALLRAGENPVAGAVVLTSRISVEMVQKTAALGASALLAISAPSDLSVRMARAAGITMITDIRRGSHRVRTHGYRVANTGPERSTGPTRPIA